MPITANGRQHKSYLWHYRDIYCTYSYGYPYGKQDILNVPFVFRVKRLSWTTLGIFLEVKTSTKDTFELFINYEKLELENLVTLLLKIAYRINRNKFLFNMNASLLGLKQMFKLFNVSLQYWKLRNLPEWCWVLYVLTLQNIIYDVQIETCSTFADVQHQSVMF